MDKLHHRMLALVALLMGMLFPAWGDEYEISGVDYGIPVISVTGGCHVIRQPIFLAFPSGDLFWNKNYFEGHKLIAAQDAIFAFDFAAIMENLERGEAVKQVHEESDSAEEFPTSARHAPRLSRQLPRLKDPYFHGVVDPGEIDRVLRDVEQLGFFYRDVPDLRADFAIVVTIVNDGISRSVRGPMGYWYDPMAIPGEVAPWDSQEMFREQWGAFIASILALANVASPTGELPDRQDINDPKRRLSDVYRGGTDFPSPAVREAEDSTNGLDAFHSRPIAPDIRG